MQCPVRLAFQQCVKNRLEQILAARGLQNGNSFVGTLMEGGIAHHDPQLIGELRPQLRQDRVEGPASLAGGIEKLDQGNRCIFRAERCGTRAQQNRIEIRNLGRPPGRLGKSLFPALILNIPSSACVNGQASGQRSEDEGAAIYGARPFGRSRRRMERKDARDSQGIGKPRMDCAALSVQDGPVCVQGMTGSGISPA